jgi:hypothetical protein
MSPNARGFAAIVVALLLLMGWIVVILLHPLYLASENIGVTVTDALGLQEPEFRESFLFELRACLNPLRALQIGGPPILLMITSFLASLVFLTVSSQIRDRFSELGLIPLVVFLPLALSIFYWPLEMKRMFRLLADAGLTAKHIVAVGCAECFVTPFWGAVASTALLIVVTMKKWLSHSPPDSHSS